jgi:hypothetical protein
MMQQMAEVIDFAGYAEDGGDIRIAILPTEGFRFDGDDDAREQEQEGEGA